MGLVDHEGRALRGRLERLGHDAPDGQAHDPLHTQLSGSSRHFDRLAAEYLDAHGPAERLLAYRLAIIRRFLQAARMGTLLEIGCGTAIHLLALAGRFGQAHGIDVSPEMVRVACRHAEVSPWRARISLRIDVAEELATVEDGSVDVVLCVGALEHMLDRARAVRQVHRVLRVGGVFICLTPGRDGSPAIAVPFAGQGQVHADVDVGIPRSSSRPLAIAPSLGPKALSQGVR